MSMDTTIAAVSSAVYPSGIGIIRISGKDALPVASRIYRSKGGRKDIQKVPSHTIHHGFIVDGSEIIDEVLVLVMRGPKSYTGEDTVEIDSHGGIVAMRRILELVCRNGAVLAEPGEFTKRAFLNGRMDLSQAEAVMGLIQAKSDLALRNSVRILNGTLAQEIRKIREKLLYQMAFVESALDDPEHYDIDSHQGQLRSEMILLSQRTAHLAATYENGKRLTEGIRTVILGKPNAGKSSLWNYLLGEERAIVTEIAGTTRDILEEVVTLGNISLRLVDTAGIHSTDNMIENIGIEKAKDMARKADLLLYVVDSSTPFEENDREILTLLEGKKAVVLYNKSDLQPVMDFHDLKEQLDFPVIPFSAKEKEGMDELVSTIQEMFYEGALSSEEEVIISSERQKQCLLYASECLNRVVSDIDAGIPEDLYYVDLMEAYRDLGEILGEEVGDDLVDEIFSKFCMGK